MNKLLPVALLIAASTTFTSAHAQFFGGDDQARRQIVELREEMSARLEASSRGQLELANQNELLRGEVAGLRGQIEVLLHEIESLKQRQRDFYVDLDERISRVEGGGVIPGTAGVPAATAGDPAAESDTYESALNLLKEGRPGDSLEAFKAFLAAYPRSSFLPGANFWAGNAALQAQEVVAARSYFNTVITTWPEDPIAPDAMLGLANSLRLMGEARSEQDTLRRIVERYPDSSAAQVARQRITAQ